jgi:predicted nucleotidyltransferase
LDQLVRQYHLTLLALFGSATREDFRPDSDVDVLVDFAADQVPGFGFVVQQELSRLLHRTVDLHIPAASPPSSERT